VTWSPGDAFLARYESADGVIRGALPLWVVSRRSGYLATWLPGGTTVARPVLADGRGLRESSLEERYENELADAVRVGVLTQQYADEIRAEGERVVAMIERWDPPFSDRWEAWRPDPAWSLPELPTDWAA